MFTYKTYFNLKPDPHHRMWLFDINNFPCGYSLRGTISFMLVLYWKIQLYKHLKECRILCFVDIAFPMCWIREPTYFGKFLIGPLINTKNCKFCNVLQFLCLASNTVPKLYHSSEQRVRRQEPLNCLCEGLLVFLLLIFFDSKSVYSLLVFERMQILNYLN